MSTSRTHAITLYGATGFTGRLVAEHLLERGVAFAIAGRNPAKLATVAGELGAPDLPQVVADAADPASLAAMAADTRVVLSTVGPFALHGDGVVAACVEAGTDYVDSTGEVQWVRRMIDAHQDAAVASGSRLVHCCGFDSIPSDLGTLVAQDAMQEQHGTYAHTVRLRVKAARGGASGGTLTSMVELLDEVAADPEVAAVMDDPYALLPAGERYGAHLPAEPGAVLEEEFGRWSAPWVMEMANGKIVRRSNALLGYPWGREFRYGERVLTGTGASGRAKAVALAGGFGVGVRAMDVDLVRSLAKRVLPSSGSGPDEAAREAGFFDIRVLAEHPTDRTKDVVVRVTADRDPGYGATARMLGESALTLAEGDGLVDGGSWTPASALGMPLVRRLEAHGGMTFEVL